MNEKTIKVVPPYTVNGDTVYWLDTIMSRHDGVWQAEKSCDLQNAAWVVGFGEGLKAAQKAFFPNAPKGPGASGGAG